MLVAILGFISFSANILYGIEAYSSGNNILLEKIGKQHKY